ncbi:putative zinc-binding protein [Flavihumibacter stibioxidans]|uniref:Zinc-binding protein n=1 Tax=Flavihumibacter stibioxidans TaxID=1834163 RepID=A0ABR7MCP8_9BACT|nr:putative zinc-binding protein [Flavihumibacter stibioxidans]MBC6492599.1 zinc-binding protein [Flavihumibacter stibioxidans]
MHPLSDPTPIVYSCSGCSSAAHMANWLALKLDRHQLAEMSCIAGVGGNVKKLVNTARSGRNIIAIDGCPLACAKACLANHGLTPDLHLNLADFNIRKRSHEDFDTSQAMEVLDIISEKYFDHKTMVQPEYNI